MDVLPLILLVLAAFVVARLVQLALDPRARQNAGAAVTGSVGRPPGGGAGR